MAMSTSTSTLSTEEQARLVESSKRAAAFQAVKDHLEPTYRLIGIGSGTTIEYVVEAIASLGPEVTSKMSFYPTGGQSRDLIVRHGLAIHYLQDLPDSLDVAFDGADEVDEDLNLIKGGGGCLWQEKIVVTAAKKFICVGDFRKISPRLGTNWKKGIPIEVHPSTADIVLRILKSLGSHDPRIRPGTPGKMGPIVTDNGNYIIDAPFSPLLIAKDLESGVKGGDGADGIWSVEALARALSIISPIAEFGLFYGKNGHQAAIGAQKPVAAYFGMADGSIEVHRAASDGSVVIDRTQV